MAMRCWPTYLLIGGLFACVPAVGEESEQAGSDECTQRIDLPSPKPDLSDYDDYSTFLVDVMRHKHREEERRQHSQRCPELYEARPIVDIPPGPDDLDKAVAESRPAESEPDQRERTSFSPAEREQLESVRLHASMETLSESAETREVRLRLLRLAEAMMDPDKDMTREEMRRVFEGQLPSEFSPLFVEVTDPKSLAQVLVLGPKLRHHTTMDDSERLFGIVYVCTGPHCPTNFAIQ